MRVSITKIEEGVRVEIVGFSGMPMTVTLPLTLEELKAAIHEAESEQSGVVI